MKNKIIFSIVFSLTLGIGAIFFIHKSYSRDDSRIHKDFYIVTGSKTVFPFEMAVDKGTTYLRAWWDLKPINTLTPAILYKHVHKTWVEVGLNDEVDCDTKIKASY